jgi:hypothetical protein
MAKLMHIFFEVDMRGAHWALKDYAKRRRVSVDDLRDGECVIFINKAWNRLKMFCGGGGEALFHLNTYPRRIEPDTIRRLPHYLNAGELDYTAALRASIREKFPYRASDEEEAST